MNNNKFLVPKERGLTIELDKEIHRILKTISAAEQCTMKQLIIRCIKDYLKKNKNKIIKEINFSNFTEALNKFISDPR